MSTTTDRLLLLILRILVAMTTEEVLSRDLSLREDIYRAIKEGSR